MNHHTGYQKWKVKKYKLEKQKTGWENTEIDIAIRENIQRNEREEKREKCQKQRGIYCRKKC